MPQDDVTRLKDCDFHSHACPIHIFTFPPHCTRFNVFPLLQPLLPLFLLSSPTFLLPAIHAECELRSFPLTLSAQGSFFTSWQSSAAEAHTASSEADPLRPAGNLVQNLGNGSSRSSWPLKWHNSSWWFDYSMRDFWPGEPAKPRLDSWPTETEHGKPFSFVRSFGVICYVAIDK